MWTTTSHPHPHTNLPDAQHFLAALNTPSNATFFASNKPIFVARAPGRLDLMGGIADYSGALVLELPLACATFAAAQYTDDQNISVRSLSAHEINSDETVTIALADIAELTYGAAHTRLTHNKTQSWAAYVVGTLLVLMHEKKFRPKHGVRILVSSNVPAGKGVSSSAAIEVATMQALNGLFNINDISGRELALLCQKAENWVVGAPCGVMDQMTSANGERDSLLALLCQPAELQGNVKIPETLAVWGIDSGVRHAVTGADYGSVRVGAFMGYRMVAAQAGLPVLVLGDGCVAVEDARWNGYLANISPSEWEAQFCAYVPERMHGDKFLREYGGFTDSVTKIDPKKTYAVRQPTAHPIYEHHRVSLFRELLQAGAEDHFSRELLGELMYQSHQSYSACGLGSDATDLLVKLVRATPKQDCLYGAKITGGGSGGTVAVLGRSDAGETVQRVASEYAKITGRQPLILQGSSQGAVQVGVWQVQAK